MELKIPVPHPGEYIEEEIEARGWLQRDLAYILGVPIQAVNMLISGKRGISPDMAKSLGDAFDVSAELFINLQSAFDLSKANDPDPSIARRARLQEQYPIREMIRRGWLDNSNDASMLEAQMTRFFDVNRLEDIPYLDHAAKKSSYDDEASALQIAWLYRVKQIAKEMVVPKFSEGALRDVLTDLAALMIAPDEARYVPKLMSECGVRYVVVEQLPQAKIDGACFWLDKDSPVIGMSMRFDRIDNFWFVLRHEIEHVLRKHGMNNGIIDDLENDRAGMGDNLAPEEREANEAASQFCVNKGELDSFIARKNPYMSERDVLGFARRVGVHPGIVIGQIHARTGDYRFLRKHLAKIKSVIVSVAPTDGWGDIYPVIL